MSRIVLPKFVRTYPNGNEVEPYEHVTFRYDSKPTHLIHHWDKWAIPALVEFEDVGKEIKIYVADTLNTNFTAKGKSSVNNNLTELGIPWRIERFSRANFESSKGRNGNIRHWRYGWMFVLRTLEIKDLVIGQV